MTEIGTSEKRITPQPGIELCGYLLRVQPSVGKYDDLYGKVLYIKSNGKKIVWIHCDLVGFSNDIADQIRRAVATKLTIEVSNIFLSATHTHAGPATMPLRMCGDIDRNYIDFLAKTLVEGAVEAASNTEKVSVYFSETSVAGVTIDRRRPSENSHVDKKMPVLAFRRVDGSIKAVSVNFAIHNVGLSSENRNISADIAGFAAKLARSKISDNPLVLFTNGGCGNINPATKSEDYSEVEKAGTILGNHIVDAISKLESCGECDISSSFFEVELPLEVFSIKELDGIRDAYRLSNETRDPKLLIKRSDEAWNSWYEETRNLIESGKAPEVAMAYIHILNIGPVTFVGINAEVFSRMAEQLRQATGLQRLYVVGYANGCMGYLAPRGIYEEGGYEVDGAYKYYGNFRLRKDGFELVRSRIEKQVVK